MRTPIRLRSAFRRRTAQSCLLAVSASVLTVLGAAPAAHATGTPFPATDTLDGRIAKDLSDHAYPNRYPAGSSVNIVCQDTGPATYGGSNIWDYTADGLWVVDYYIKTGYSGFDPNIPRCDENNSPALQQPGAHAFPATATLDGRSTKDLNDHAYPNKYAQGSMVSIVCQDTGPDAYGSNIWDYTSDGLWVTDTYIKTGSSGFVSTLPRCADGGTPAAPGGRQFLVGATLDGRSTKDLNDHAYPNKYAQGSMVTITCQESGPDAYGSTVWDKTSDNLWVTDKYVKTGYTGFTPDLPNCGGDTGTPPPSTPDPGTVRGKIVAALQSQVGVYPEHDRDNCEPYYTDFGTPYHCGEPWCAYFASWAWRQAGVWGANFGGSNQFYYWAAPKGLLRDFNHIKPGDAVIYGSLDNSVHIGVVETVLSDGRIGTIEGNWGDGVVRKSPFDPRNTGGEPIYAIVSPIHDEDGETALPDLPHTGNVFPATATLDGRSVKDLNNHDFPDKYPAGSMVSVKCQDTGPDAYGSNIWDYTYDNLWVPDYYVKTGYSGMDPDVPQCGSEPSPPTSTTPPQTFVNPAYTEALNKYTGFHSGLYAQAILQTVGGGTDDDLVLIRAYIHGGDFWSDKIKDRDGPSADLDAPYRVAMLWEPKSGLVGLTASPSCPGGVCKSALTIKPMPLGFTPVSECEGGFHPTCMTDFNNNLIAVGGSNGHVHIQYQFANAEESIPFGGTFFGTGAIDGNMDLTQGTNGAGYDVSMMADQFPSYEIIQIPHYNTTGQAETHLKFTREQKTLKYLCTSCYGQTGDLTPAS
ncbi:CHAP domain-containing protein [Kitasatospora acidiphila]|uniref:CHAP domain-containing protein n=1 Tax=Kitasatospora acidiphila TaxID=2567942 RepID=A0A540WD45_9ACTN|nr:CHAP domain-containing protein [Kitasatospora acidiphila]TQF06961.1 CHAP domain-containing protein [Kitasatospora acidiphila]